MRKRIDTRLFELIDIVKQEEINPSLKVLGIPLNTFNRSFNVNKRTREKLETAYPGLIFDSFIRKNMRLSDGAGDGNAGTCE